MFITQAGIDRFHSKITRGESPDDCWQWLGDKTGNGYGQLYIRYNRKSYYYSAHRVSFVLANGYEPDDMVLHSCDNRACCNPAHLRAGSHADNMLDRTIRSRGNHPVGSAVGVSKLTEAQVEEIYKLRKTNLATNVAKKYNVSGMDIGDIWGKRRWVHLTDRLDAEATAAWELLKQSLPKITRS